MHIKFAVLPVSDQDRARDFYVRNLGCKVAVDRPYKDDGWRWIELSFPGAQTTLQFERRDGDVPGTMPILVLVDSDLDATFASLKSRGVEIITDPREAPWEPGRRYGEFQDSEGNRIVMATN